MVIGKQFTLTYPTEPSADMTWTEETGTWD